MSTEKLHHKERIKKVREELRLSQQELAEKLGIPVHKIKDVEGGKTKITVDLAGLLEEIFHLDFKWLLTGKGSMRVEERPSPLAQPDHVNSELLRQTLEAVEGGLARSGIKVDPAKKATLISLLYEYSGETGKPIRAETVDRYLGLIT
jgi:transcriptional regulator with XRE-family HTH domain